MPPSAAAIFQHADKFRQQIGSLDLMVGLYNKLQRTTLPVERPLVAAKLDAAGKHACFSHLLTSPAESAWPAVVLWAGACVAPSTACFASELQCHSYFVRFNVVLNTIAEAALQRGLQELVWRSGGIDAYIKDTLDMVKDLDGVLTTIKDNVAKTVEILKGFERKLMFERKVQIGMADPCARKQFALQAALQLCRLRFMRSCGTDDTVRAAAMLAGWQNIHL